MPEPKPVSRRALVRSLLFMSGMAPAFLAIARSTAAMSRAPIVPGVQAFTGDFRLNGAPARVGQLVSPGDIATTGPGGSASIVIGRHAFLLRSDSRIEFFPVYFEKEGRVSGIIKVATGALLSVFGATDKTTISTPIAQLGIRGTGCYVDSRPDRTYACVCYGQADLTAAATGQVLETVTTTYHDMPRYIFPPGQAAQITSAPVIDHTDAELRLLESLVHRTPPFDDANSELEDRY